jgi:DNA repair protein RecO (recombination protein O)
MNKTYSTKAIILNRKDFRESDRLFVLYTKDYGKIEAVATGARKSTSKMAKFLEPLMEIELLLARGRIYDKIAEVRLIDNFSQLKQDKRQWALGCYCLEVINKLTKVEDSHTEIFELLVNILNLLKQGNSNLVQFYVWQLLSNLGYHPRLENCVTCNTEFNSGILFFNYYKGGVQCQECSSQEKNGIKITFNVLNVLRQGLRTKLNSLQNINIQKDESRQINQAISSLLNFHLDYSLNSVRFLR